MEIAGWFASAVIGKVIGELIQYGIDRCKLQLGVDLRDLEKALPMIQAVTDAAESGMITHDSAALQQWLSQIVNITGEAENVLDEIEYQTLKKKVEMGNKHKVSKIPSPLTKFAKRVFSKDSTWEIRLKKVVKEISEVAAKADLFFKLVDISKQRQEQQRPNSISNRETSPLLSTEVFGREKEKEDLIQKLLSSSRSDGKKFSILPIVGVGGVGKTTLAKLVYNDEKVIVKHFPLKMWVCVSDCFDVTLLTKKMLDDPNSLSLAALQEKLKEKVKSKRFLLVLDDVWYDEDNCGNKWSELFAPLRYADPGSMIVLTTRKETVVAKLPMSPLESNFLKGIKKDEYWELFKMCAFGDSNLADYNDLLCIGREIAKKLKGSPLAAKTIGGILRDKLSPEHWTNILEKDMWAIKQGENDIMPALRLSYQHLDAHLKPCFRFCSIFPQDHIFRKEKLVQMWIAVGLVQQPKNDNRRLEDIGEEYLDSLVRKSFFDYHNIFEKYVMHDLMHELAKAVSVGECSSVDTIEDKLKMVPNTVRHLSINITNHLINPVTSHLRNLRTLILIIDAKDPQLPTVIGELLKGLKSLRILDFIEVGWNYYSNITIGQIHDNISELIHLRYLDATFVDIMQILSLRLYQLQVLVIRKVEEGKKLDLANNLISLRHLTTDNYVTNMIPNIGKLTSLQELKRFCVQKESGYKMNQLKNMNELRELGICNLENVESYEEATEANFKGKVHLNCLSLAWNNYHEQADRLQNFEERVVNHLQPPKKLKELVIDGYSGAPSPCWLTKIEYASNLVSISLSNCKRWDSLPPFEKLPLLKSLKMDEMAAVKALGFPADWKDDEVCDFPSRHAQQLFEKAEKREELWNTEEGIKQWKWFQSLSVLQIHNCHNMKRMPRLPLRLTDFKIQNNEALICLPELYPLTLHRLSIRDCPKLTSLPHSLLWNPERFTALKELRILGTTNLIHLPVGGFSKLVNLGSLKIGDCPKLERSSTSIMESKRLLPSSLKDFRMSGRCGINLEASLLESLNDLTSLSGLYIVGCNNITTLSPVDDFKSSISLKYLIIQNCRELVSLGGLQASVSLEHLEISGCEKILESVDQFIPTSSIDVNWRDEVEDSSSSTKAGSTPLIQDSTLSLENLTIDSPLLLETKHLQSAKVRCLVIKDCPDQLLSLPEQWLMQRCNSLEELHIKGAKALQSLPATLQTLSSLKEFYLSGATDLQSLPKMPPSLDYLTIRDCNPVLKKRCEKNVGPDWPNIAHVTNIEIT